MAKFVERMTVVHEIEMNLWSLSTHAQAIFLAESFKAFDTGLPVKSAKITPKALILELAVPWDTTMNMVAEKLKVLDEAAFNRRVELRDGEPFELIDMLPEHMPNVERGKYIERLFKTAHRCFLEPGEAGPFVNRFLDMPEETQIRLLRAYEPPGDGESRHGKPCSCDAYAAIVDREDGDVFRCTRCFSLWTGTEVVEGKIIHRRVLKFGAFKEGYPEGWLAESMAEKRAK